MQTLQYFLLLKKKTVFHEATQTTSETDSSENDINLSSQQQTDHACSDLNILSNLYMTDLNLRNTIKHVKLSLLWPPRAETLNFQVAEKTVPYILYNLLAGTKK